MSQSLPFLEEIAGRNKQTSKENIKGRKHVMLPTFYVVHTLETRIANFGSIIKRQVRRKEFIMSAAFATGNGGFVYIEDKPQTNPQQTTNK